METVQILSWTEYSAFTKVFSIVLFSEHACFEGFLPICSYGCSFPVHFRHHLFCGVSIYQFLSNYLCSFPPLRYTTKGLSMYLLNTPARTYSISLEIDIFGLKMMVKSGLEFFILKFTEPLQRYLLTCKANSSFLGRFFCTGQQQL